MGLNAQQQAAVRATGHTLVSSCPGSGKTTVLAYRAAHLLNTHPEARVGAVTYTAAAASELCERIGRHAAGVGRRVVAGTFHALALRQLRSVGSPPRILKEFQLRDLIRRAHQQCVGGAHPLEETEAAIAKYKSAPDYVFPDDDDPKVQAYQHYQASLEAAGAMDFADMMLQAVYGMRDGRIAPLNVQFLLVDEYQDADPVQFAWIRAHMEAGVEVTCVGDDDQSVYGFRYSMGYEGMRQFLDVGQGQEIALNTTYRCGRRILNAAALLISKNQARLPKQLRTESVIEGEVAMQGHALRVKELNAMVETVKASLEAAQSAGQPPPTWGLLARTNVLVDAAEEEIARGFAYERLGGTSVWDLKGPQLLLIVLEALDRNTFTGLDAVLTACGVSPGVVEALIERVVPRWSGSLMRFSGLSAKELGGDETEADVLLALARLSDEWAHQAATGALALACAGISRFLATRVRWAGPGRTVSPERTKLELTRLERCSARLCRLTGSLSQVLVQLRQKPSAATAPPVQLMTLHGSKGLEFDRVWIFGCEEGVLPSNKADRDEERRLMYVGMTRARAWLMLSYCKDDGAQPSEFIEEAGVFL
jgi:DNA helicase-2/ATP-dependent DNA helicase PcrA